MNDEQRRHDSWAFLHSVLAPWPEAVSFMDGLAVTLHLWDDLIDKDRAVSDSEVHLAFSQALIDLPRNGFYRANFAELNPLLKQAIVNWHVATLIEREGSGEELVTAFILRSAYVDVAAAALVILYGLEKAVPLIRTLRQHIHSEGFSPYLAALATEKDIRHGM